MYAALQSLQSKDDLKISVQDNMFVVSDAANAMQQFASQDYNLIIANGSQYGSTVQQLAAKYPKASFAGALAGSTIGLKNVFAYQAAANEGGYVQGYMAGLLSKKKVIGVIGPINMGDAQLYTGGFKAGALAADQHTTVHLSFTGSFSDVSLMASAAKSYVSEGADVLTGSSHGHRRDWRGQVRQRGLVRHPVGSVVAGPGDVVSSQAYNWVPVLSQIFTAIRAGKLGGATYTITLKNGGDKIEVDPGYHCPPRSRPRANRWRGRSSPARSRRLSETSTAATSTVATSTGKGRRRWRAPLQRRARSRDARDHQALPGGARQRPG